MVACASPDISIISAPGRPTATVRRACGKRPRIAPSAGKLMTTSPSWPKSITRILRGLKVTSDIYRKNLLPRDMRAANPDAAENRGSRRDKSTLQSRHRWLAAAAPDLPSAKTQRCDRRRHESTALATSIFRLDEIGEDSRAILL